MQSTRIAFALVCSTMLNFFIRCSHILFSYRSSTFKLNYILSSLDLSVFVFQFPVRSDKIWFVFTIFLAIWYQTDFRLIPNHLEGFKCNLVTFSLVKARTSFFNYLENVSDISIKLVYLTVYRKCFFRRGMFIYSLPVKFHCLMQLSFCFWNLSRTNDFLFSIRSNEIWVAFAIFRLIDFHCNLIAII